jgi:hypothetical protein
MEHMLQCEQLLHPLQLLHALQLLHPVQLLQSVQSSPWTVPACWRAGSVVSKDLIRRAWRLTRSFWPLSMEVAPEGWWCRAPGGARKTGAI